LATVAFFHLCPALVTLLAQDSTENVLWVKSVAKSATFRQVNKNDIQVNDTDSILWYLNIFTYAALCKLQIKASNILQHIQLLMQKIQKRARMVCG
jgi:hypothetical protein